MAYTNAQPVIEHVQKLAGWGMTQTMIANATNGRVTQTAVRAVLIGDRRWTQDYVADALLDAGPHPQPSQARVLAVGAERRIRALHRRGWTSQDIADRAGIHIRTLRAALRRPTITYESWSAIAAAYEPMSADPAPGPSVITARRARKWPLPLDWEAADIDDPDSWPEPARVHENNDYEQIVIRREIVAELTRVGWSATSIAAHLRVTERTVERDRKRLRVGAAEETAGHKEVA